MFSRMKRFIRRCCRRVFCYGGVFSIICLLVLGLKLNTNVLKKEKNLRKKIFIESKYENAGESINHLRIINQTIIYPPFAISKPHFIDERDGIIFFNNEKNVEAMKEVTKNRLLGQIVTQRNATVRESFDCGWKTNFKEFENLSNRKGKNVPIAAGLLVPQSDSFQHFMDGVMPKLIQGSYQELPIFKIPKSNRLTALY